MVLVDDDPFATGLAQPGGQTKVDMSPGGAFAMGYRPDRRARRVAEIKELLREKYGFSAYPASQSSY